ncbi:hypothetical protein DL98DRAFT_514856 [Cadophora sp. DSE1049]|nr:hypothetical protein DL98DRAFT_514856 [Cadophora sp. DSE1049]
MPRLQHPQIRWSKSWPTDVTAPISAFTCTHERGSKPCKKTFSRQCDLRQHEKNHIRPSHCLKCTSRFPSPKDLERHENTVHNTTLKYFCPYAGCQESIHLESEYWSTWGFGRKDHWLKHLRTEHSTSKDEVKAVQKAGIPIARLEEGTWIAVRPKPVTVGDGMAESSEGDVELAKGASL